MPKRFDLERAVAADPPGPGKRKDILAHPRVATWLGDLMALRQARGVSLDYIARMLTKGCHTEGILPADQSISEYRVRRWWRANIRG